MPKLTDSQLVILSAAARRQDRAVLPLPRSLKVHKAATTTALKSLLKKGLAAERPAAADEAHWRETRDGGRTALVIATSPHKGTVQERTPVGGQLQHEDVPGSVVAGVVSPRGGGEVRGLRTARDHGVVITVQRQRGGETIV